VAESPFSRQPDRVHDGPARPRVADGVCRPRRLFHRSTLGDAEHGYRLRLRSGRHHAGCIVRVPAGRGRPPVWGSAHRCRRADGGCDLLAGIRRRASRDDGDRDRRLSQRPPVPWPTRRCPDRTVPPPAGGPSWPCSWPPTTGASAAA